MRRGYTQPNQQTRKKRKNTLFFGKLNIPSSRILYSSFCIPMPRCPGCQYPICPTEILCDRCFYEDHKVPWPQCHHCFQWTANCGESSYTLCYPCYHVYIRKLYLAALPIQTIARGFLTRRRLKKDKAAKTIQSSWRGWVTRTSINLNGTMQGWSTLPLVRPPQCLRSPTNQSSG